jgi:glycosyltransferase involved in cell wall biosynthesis
MVDRRFGFVSHVYSWGVGRPAWMDDMDLAGHRAADIVVCSAGSYERRLREGGVEARRLVRVPWGVTIDAAGARARAERLDGALGPRVGFVGRIEPRKGQLALVRGFAAVRRRMPSATLEFVGPVADPGYEQRIREEIRRRGLSNAVRLRGHLRSTSSAVASWDLFASLSSDEGQGLAILEAMALGVPVAARVVPGVEDYFEPGVNGIGVRSARPHDVADAIVQGTRSSKRVRDCVRRGRALVRRRYSWAATDQAIERLYRRVQGGAR